MCVCVCVCEHVEVCEFNRVRQSPPNTIFLGHLPRNYHTNTPLITCSAIENRTHINTHAMCRSTLTNSRLTTHPNLNIQEQSHSTSHINSKVFHLLRAKRDQDLSPNDNTFMSINHWGLTKENPPNGCALP